MCEGPEDLHIKVGSKEFCQNKTLLQRFMIFYSEMTLEDKRGEGGAGPKPLIYVREVHNKDQK